MSRRKRPAPDTVREQPAGGRKADRPFAELAALMRKNASDAAPARAPRADPEAGGKSARRAAQGAGDPPAASADEVLGVEELALFRQAVGDARPLRDSGRTEIERPRPAPRPRPQTDAELAGEATRPARETDPLRAAYEGVVPLRDTGRVEVGVPPRRGQVATSHGPLTGVDELPILMPADADETDPSTLFRQVVGAARPVDTRNRVELERPSPAPAPFKREEDERAALGESLAAPLSFEDRLDMGDEAAFLRTGLPRRVLTDLRRGRWVLQGQIDLHGLTRDEARDALAAFLANSLQQGLRCIRVIHGKGLGSPGRVSILKQLSRGWLAQREEILAFCQAGPHDGGAGALLVLMRAQNASRS